MCQQWKPKFGVGSMIALMLPYSAAFGAAGMLLILAWVGFQLPVGPGAPAAYHLPKPAAVASQPHAPKPVSGRGDADD